MNNSIIPFYNQKNKYIVRSKDCSFYDDQGHQYLDFESGDWATNIGHSRDEIIESIKYQAQNIIHDGLQFRSQISEDLSHKLLDKLNLNNGKSAFLNSGSEAVNLGITIARYLTKRKKVLKMDCSYLSAFGYGHISMDNADLISIPINSIETIAELDFSQIAVFVLEAGSSGGLVKFPSNEFIKSLTELAKEKGTLLMANEVTVGFGRTGKWFGYQHYDYHPDIVATGKALGNGYPISGVSISRELSELFDINYFRYAQSHQNDPLGCTVALRVMNIIDSTNLVERSEETGNYFKEKLIQLHHTFPSKIKEIRGRGLMLAVEFVQTIDVKTISNQLLERGIIVGCKDNVIRFMPPLIIKKEEIVLAIKNLNEIMKLN